MSGLTIRLLDEFQVLRDGHPVTLPASRKTRALLAYLVRTDRPCRRDRLCELFWEIPDDPRGALRWSLCKLRRVVNDSDVVRLLADRERVAFVGDDVEIDTRHAASRLAEPGLTPCELGDIVWRLRRPLLDGMDLPNQKSFQSWLVAERREHEWLFARAAERLALETRASAQQRLDGAQAWCDARPFDPRAASRLLSALHAVGASNEAAGLARSLSVRFREAGIEWSPILTPEPPATLGDVRAGAPAPASSDAEVRVPPEASLPVVLPASASDDQPVFTDRRRMLSRQTIRFCSSSDDVRLAYARVGEGPPLVKAANWLSHLELDWDAPIWSPLFHELARDHQFIRYDERGNGLSDWDVDDIAFETWVTDLETVVDELALDRFALLGISQGAAVSIEYAVRHPERVSRLILFGAYAAGWRRNGASPETVREREAIITLTRAGWGQPNPAYRHIFSSTFLPSASSTTLDWFNEFQRRTTSPENAARFLSAFADIDVRHRLAEVRVPTLVMHSLGDQRCPVALGREIAAGVPGAEFIGLESDGHLLLGDEPASKVFLQAVRRFLGEPVKSDRRAGAFRVSPRTADLPGTGNCPYSIPEYRRCVRR